MTEIKNPYPFPRAAFLKAISASEYTKKVERSQGVYQVWDVYEDGIASYQDSFSGGFPIDIKDYIAHRAASQVPTYGLDVMGPGTAISNIGLKKGLALTLNRDLTNVAKEVSVIAGDVNRRKSWQRVQAWLARNRQPQGFDLIFFRPIRGMECLPFNPRAHFALLQRMWSFLNPEGGMLLAEGHTAFNDDAKILCAAWEAGGEVDYRAQFSVDNRPALILSLTKHPTSPKLLPVPSSLAITEARPSSLLLYPHR